MRQIATLRKPVVSGVACLVAGFAAWWYWYVNLRGYVSTDDAYVDGNRMTISAQIPGRIVHLTVQEGDTVEPGQRLVQLDDSDLRAQEAQAQTNLALARDKVTLAQATLRQAQENFDYAAALYKQRGIASQVRYEHARNALALAQAQYDLSRTGIQAAQAQLGIIQTRLYDTQIPAPASGVVAKKWVMPGDVVQPGQPIYTLYDLRDVWITAKIEETQIATIHPHDTVEIFVDAYPGQHFRGQVTRVGVVTASQFALIPPNNASGNFTKVTQRIPVKIAISHHPPVAEQDPIPLLPGMSVEVKIKVGEDAP